MLKDFVNFIDIVYCIYHKILLDLYIVAKYFGYFLYTPAFITVNPIDLSCKVISTTSNEVIPPKPAEVTSTTANETSPPYHQT